MKQLFKQLLVAGCALLMGATAMAKLPALSDEAKMKAAEASAKAAWSAKVDGFLLCKSQDRIAAHAKKNTTVAKETKAVIKDAKPATAASACVDPGPFVYAPPLAAAAASAPTAAVPAPKP
jgi:hypothetical protein